MNANVDVLVSRLKKLRKTQTLQDTEEETF